MPARLVLVWLPVPLTHVVVVPFRLQDYVNVVKFSTDAAPLLGDSLVQATSANLLTLRSLVDQVGRLPPSSARFSPRAVLHGPVPTD
jgi:hypothetical protein